MGPRIRKPSVAPDGLKEKLDRLAALLAEHSPERLAAFLEQELPDITPEDLANPQTISDQLKSAIKASGLTIYVIAKASGVDPGMISRFMQGERTLRLTTVDRIAATLGLSLSGGETPEQPPESE